VRGRDCVPGVHRRVASRTQVLPGGLLSPADAVRASGLRPKEFVAAVRDGRINPVEPLAGVRAFRPEDVRRLAQALIGLMSEAGTRICFSLDEVTGIVGDLMRIAERTFGPTRSKTSTPALSMWSLTNSSSGHLVPTDQLVALAGPHR